MTEITQADRDAAMRWAGALPRGEFERLLTIADDAAIKARMEERAAIVAWLHEQHDVYNPSDNWSAYWAEQIEAGKHIK